MKLYNINKYNFKSDSINNCLIINQNRPRSLFYFLTLQTLICCNNRYNCKITNKLLLHCNIHSISFDIEISYNYTLYLYDGYSQSLFALIDLSPVQSEFSGFIDYSIHNKHIMEYTFFQWKNISNTF